MEFTELRDGLIEHTLLFWENKPITTEAWRGITRGAEFARQCRTLHDFETKWMPRYQQGLGLFDAWSTYTALKPRPHQAVESETINRIYRGLLFAVGVEQSNTPADNAFAAAAITDLVIKKAKHHARPSPA